MYDNLIESMERYRDSPKGFGCILAHAMGLGKTMQVVAFTDIFLRHTPAKKVLCIVPINTIQNWVAEFNRWLPSADSLPDGGAFDVRPRSFELYLLNDSQKNLEQRSGIATTMRFTNLPTDGSYMQRKGRPSLNRMKH